MESRSRFWMVFGSGSGLRWGLGSGVWNGGLRFRIRDWYWGFVLRKQMGDKGWLLFGILVLE